MTRSRLDGAAITMLATKRELEGREPPTPQPSVRTEIRGFLQRRPGEVFTGIEVATEIDLASTAAQRQSVYETLPRMWRLGQVERRVITDEEIAERGAGRHTLWLWWVS